MTATASSPTADDGAVTGRLVKADSNLGLDVLGLIVLGDGRWRRLRLRDPGLFASTADSPRSLGLA
jgi:hypothetical protein